MPSGSSYGIYGTLNAGPKNAFASLTSIEGDVFLRNGQTTNITPIGGTLTNSGNFDIGNGTTVSITGDVVNNNLLTTGENVEGGNNTLNISGTLTNNRFFFLTGSGDVANVGNLVNDGTLDIGSTLNISGTLTNNSGGSFVLYGPGGTATIGSVVNTGLIDLEMNLSNGAGLSTPTLNNGGTINVDNLSTFLVGIGVLHGPITNYTQLANGTLGEIITPNSFGVINLNGGSALLAGTLDILLQGGFNPAVGKMYQFLIGVAPGQLNGTFGSVLNDVFNGGTEKWLVTYDNADGYVELVAENNGAPVSEPATVLMLIPGLLGAGYGLRRKLCRP